MPPRPLQRPQGTLPPPLPSSLPSPGEGCLSTASQGSLLPSNLGLKSWSQLGPVCLLCSRLAPASSFFLPRFIGRTPTGPGLWRREGGAGQVRPPYEGRSSTPSPHRPSGSRAGRWGCGEELPLLDVSPGVHIRYSVQTPGRELFQTSDARPCSETGFHWSGCSLDVGVADAPPVIPKAGEGRHRRLVSSPVSRRMTSPYGGGGDAGLGPLLPPLSSGR